MTRYFFDIRDRGGLVSDEEGVVFEAIMAAVSEARASANDLRNQRANNFEQANSDGLRIELRADGRLISIFPVFETFSFTVPAKIAANDQVSTVTKLI